MASVASELGVGELTLSDIVDEILKPGRDIRADLPAPQLRADLMDINDLKEGMELTGTVRNVIDFGAFVDIGVHHDGLVHVSEISDRFIKHPSEALSVGQTVKVKVIGVEPVKNRINLSIKQASGYKSEKVEKTERPREERRDNRRPDNRRDASRRPDNRPKREERSLDDMLNALKNKFSKH